MEGTDRTNIRDACRSQGIRTARIQGDEEHAFSLPLLNDSAIRRRVHAYSHGMTCMPHVMTAPPCVHPDIPPVTFCDPQKWSARGYRCSARLLTAASKASRASARSSYRCCWHACTTSLIGSATRRTLRFRAALMAASCSRPSCSSEEIKSRMSVATAAALAVRLFATPKCSRPAAAILCSRLDGSTSWETPANSPYRRGPGRHDGSATTCLAGHGRDRPVSREYAPFAAALRQYLRTHPGDVDPRWNFEIIQCGNDGPKCGCSR